MRSIEQKNRRMEGQFRPSRAQASGLPCRTAASGGPALYPDGLEWFWGRTVLGASLAHRARTGPGATRSIAAVGTTHHAKGPRQAEFRDSQCRYGWSAVVRSRVAVRNLILVLRQRQPPISTRSCIRTAPLGHACCSAISGLSLRAAVRSWRLRRGPSDVHFAGRRSNRLRRRKPVPTLCNVRRVRENPIGSLVR
jgi:hypothetical protein